MNLRDALLCIDCDEVFSAEEHACNPRCPSCGSSVFAALACWVQTLTAIERSGDDNGVTRFGTAATRRGMEIVRSTSIAA